MPTKRSAPVSRPEPRETIELRRLRVEHPELETAVDLQVELLDLQRRVIARIPLPARALQVTPLEALARGRPLLTFSDLPLEWSDFRRSLRETADLLRRFDLLEENDHHELLGLQRDGHQLEFVVTQWFAATLASAGAPPAEDDSPGVRAAFDQVFALALRPFLARCAEALIPRLDLESWGRGYCPLCGGDPDLAVYTAEGRRLICGRCGGRWPFESPACPFCPNVNPQRITSLASRDRRYRVDACDVCMRYVKAFDERGADRPVMPGVDTIATLPLDAAAIQRGYQG